ncbi:MAG: O-antigen ligase family protein [Opitutae bacterium]|nr:O-antigen ligase family protein [Opitutae bacterium]MBT6461217.1 O-antigen ligase family protein [Opitutae bacterium]MBT7852595.1 O-antigen ligase family protein [Opitutae bacterium]
MKNEQEKLGGLAILGLIIFSTWGAPGQITPTENALTWGCLLFLAVPFFANWRHPRTTLCHCIPFIKNSIIEYRAYTSIVFLFFGLVILGGINPCFEPAGSVKGFLTSIPNVPWGPSTVLQELTFERLPKLAVVLILLGPSVFFLINRRSTLRLILWGITANMVILSIVGIFVKLSGGRKILGYIEPTDARYFFSTFSYKNHWGAYCILTLGVIGALTHFHLKKEQPGKSKHNSPIPLLVNAGIIIGLTVPLSGSRSCSVLYGLLFAVYLGKLIVNKLTSSNSIRMKSLISGTIAVGVSLMITYSALLLHEENKEEIFRTTSRQYKNLIDKGQKETRFYISRDTLKLIREKPLFGWGLGSYSSIINVGRYLGPEHKGTRFDHAHNDWLEYIAETGIAGFILLGFIFVAPYKIYRGKGTTNPISRWLWGGTIVIIIYSIVEFPCRTPAVSFLMTILVAISTKYGLIEKERKSIQQNQRFVY